jgi:hypothetical protein
MDQRNLKNHLNPINPVKVRLLAKLKPIVATAVRLTAFLPEC